MKFPHCELHLVLWRVNTISYAFAYLWHKNFQKIFSPKKCFATTITLINLTFVLRMEYVLDNKKSCDDSVFSLMEAIIKVRTLQKCTSQCRNYRIFLLREIKVGECGDSKSASFTHSKALNFDIYEFFHF